VTAASESVTLRRRRRVLLHAAKAARRRLPKRTAKTFGRLWYLDDDDMPLHQIRIWFRSKLLMRNRLTLGEGKE
jgi:hypothetical protein